MIQVYNAKELNLASFCNDVRLHFNATCTLYDGYISVDVEDTPENIAQLEVLIANHDKLAADLSLAKTNKISSLWSSVVAMQNKYFYDSDKIEVRGIVRQGTASNLSDCEDIQLWLDGLYDEYYTLKSAIYASEDAESLNSIDISFNGFTPPGETLTRDKIWR